MGPLVRRHPDILNSENCVTAPGFPPIAPAHLFVHALSKNQQQRELRSTWLRITEQTIEQKTVWAGLRPLARTLSNPTHLSGAWGISTPVAGVPPAVATATCPRSDPPLLYNPSVPDTTATRLDRVLAQLRLYEHPLLNFSARAKGEGVEVIIRFKDVSVPVHTYYFDLHPRDLDHPQFEWSFQRQLYDALHDYFMEMFIRTPQDRAERRQKGL